MEKLTTFKVLRVLSLVPILMAPVVYYTTILFTDDPNYNETLVRITVVLVNAYPLYLIANTLISNRIYPTNKKLAYALLIWPLVLAVITVIVFLA